MTTRIKICGITRPEDAEVVADCGADALGVICYDKSPRNVEPEAIKNITRLLPPFMTTVAVVVNPVPGFIKLLEDHSRVDRIQFHGDESQAELSITTLPYYKSLRIKPDSDVMSLAEMYPNAAALLLDTFVQGKRGGSGQTFNWTLITGISITQPVILAGGLDPDNVYDAVLAVKPYAVDVSSGVEVRPGIKDAIKVNEFIIAVREADQETHKRRHSL